MSVRNQRRNRSADAASVRDGPGAAALTILSAGSLALAVAPLLPVVSSTDSSPVSPGYLSWPLLAALALVPPLAAVLARTRGAAEVATGLLLATAALAPCRALLDLQILLEPDLAARPELLVATSLAPLQPAPGAMLLLVGHVLTAGSGVLALIHANRRDEPAVEAPGARDRAPVLVLTLCLGAALAVGLLAAPFESTNAYLLGRGAFDAPGWTRTGALALAVLAPATACVLAGAPHPDRARGGLLGVAAGVTAVAAPALVAGLRTEALQPEWGPVTVLLAAAGLIGCAVAVTRPAGTGRTTDLVLAGVARLHRLAGAAALLAGVLALSGALLPVIEAAQAPTVSAARWLLPAAAVLLVLGAALLLPGQRAAALRPVLAVAWVALLMPAAAVLGTALSALEIAAVDAGPGAAAVAVAVPVATVAAVCCALAGAVERDEVDMAALVARGAHRPLLLASGGAGVLAVAAFALPVVAGPGYRASAITPALGLGGWGLVAGLAAVVLAAAVATRARPERAAGLLAGAGLVVLVRMSELALAPGPVTVAAGTWAALACLAALGAAVAVARYSAVRAGSGRGGRSRSGGKP